MLKTKKLTARQKEVFKYLKTFIKSNGYPPTVRDIASYLKIVSLNAVRRHLIALEKKEYIKLERGKSRGIKIIEKEIPHKFYKNNKIPILGKVAAGSLSSAIEDIEDYIAVDPNFWGQTQELFILKVKGDSMYPRLEEGDMVIVRSQSYAHPGDLVIALKDDEATIKQLIIKNKRYWLHPINTCYEDIKINENFFIRGIVVGLIRKIID